MADRGRTLARGGDGRFHGQQATAVGLEPHDGSRGGLGDQLFRVNFKDARARACLIRPFGDPLQTERGIDAVQIRDSREQTEGMLANVDAHRAALELEDGSRQWRQKPGRRAFAGEAEERAVNHGESKGESGHGEACQASSSIRAGDQKLLGRDGKYFHDRRADFLPAAFLECLGSPRGLVRGVGISGFQLHLHGVTKAGLATPTSRVVMSIICRRAREINLARWKTRPIQKNVSRKFSLDTLHARVALAIGMTALLALVPAALAAVPDYKLGDVAAEDVITPVPLTVVNAEATEALKQKLAQEVPFVLRYNPAAAAQAETELRQQVDIVRSSFFAALQRVLRGRSLIEASVDSPIFSQALAETARETPKDFPLDTMARFWIRGASDETFVQALVGPLREAVAQPIVQNGVETNLPRNQTFRIVEVANFIGTATREELERPEQTILSTKVLSLVQARRTFAARFTGALEDQGRFLATFIRPNAAPDPAIREMLRTIKMEGAAVHETYAASQLIVQKGQTIDRPALAALALMRQKSPVGMAPGNPGQSEIGLGYLSRQPILIVVGLTVMGLILFVSFRGFRRRRSTEWVVVEPESSGWEPVEIAQGEDGGEVWRYRTADAERKIERANAAIRSGVLGWMRDKVFRSLVRQRGDLLSAQEKAEQEIRELVERLEQLHAPLQERIAAYEKRIADLERELAAKDEQNRELIGSRIYVTQQQLTLERERRDFGTN